MVRIACGRSAAKMTRVPSSVGPMSVGPARAGSGGARSVAADATRTAARRRGRLTRTPAADAEPAMDVRVLRRDYKRGNTRRHDRVGGFPPTRCRARVAPRLPRLELLLDHGARAVYVGRRHTKGQVALGMLQRDLGLEGAGAGLRSEERRVGKECRSRGAPDH